MADPIQNLAAANDAYQATLTALAKVHATQDALIAANPVDWDAYNAAVAATTAGQKTAQAALGVYQAAILDTDEVQALVTQLQADTKTMTQRAQALQQQAQSLKDFADAADAVTSVLTGIAALAA